MPCFIYLFFIIVLGVHCGINKSSYNVSNISYLNSPPPPLSLPLVFSVMWMVGKQVNIY
jgi:hypothetical protein